MELEDILFTGGNNTPGLGSQTVWIAKVEDIESMTCGCEADPDNLTEAGTISDNIVMKEDKSFSQIYFTDETGELMHTLIGELDGKAVKNSLKFFHPKETPQLLGFIGQNKNSKGFVFIVKDKDCNQRVFGNTCTPAKLVNGEGGTKAKQGDRKGTEMLFEYVSGDVAPYFTGKVDLTGFLYGSGSANDFQTLFVN